MARDVLRCAVIDQEGDEDRNPTLLHLTMSKRVALAMAQAIALSVEHLLARQEETGDGSAEVEIKMGVALESSIHVGGR